MKRLFILFALLSIVGSAPMVGGGGCAPSCDDVGACH